MSRVLEIEKPSYEEQLSYEDKHIDVYKKLRFYIWNVMKHEIHAQERLQKSSNELELLEDRVMELSRRLEALEAKTKSIRPNKTFVPRDKADDIYEKYKSKLENKHWDEIVAIDADAKEIVGYGNTVREAYEDARLHTNKEQFHFRRVGKPFIRRLL